MIEQTSWDHCLTRLAAASDIRYVGAAVDHVNQGDSYIAVHSVT